MLLWDFLTEDWIDMERNDYLIKRKFYNYLVPGVLMVVAMQLGNVVDGIIVGNIIGSSAIKQPITVMPEKTRTIFCSDQPHISK